MPSSDSGGQQPPIVAGDADDEARRERRRLKKLRKQEKRKQRQADEAAAAVAAADTALKKAARATAASVNSSAPLDTSVDAPKTPTSHADTNNSPAKDILGIFSRLAEEDVAGGVKKRKRSAETNEDDDGKDNHEGDGGEKDSDESRKSHRKKKKSARANGEDGLMSAAPANGDPSLKASSKKKKKSAAANEDVEMAVGDDSSQQIGWAQPLDGTGDKAAAKPKKSRTSKSKDIDGEVAGLDDEAVFVPIKTKKKKVVRRLPKGSDDESDFEVEVPSSRRLKKTTKKPLRDAPLASGSSGGINLSPAETALATRWMTLKSLQKYTEVHSFTYRKGRFGRDEDKALEMAVDDYARQRKLSKEEVAAVIAAKKVDSNVYDTEFWPYISLSYARKYGARPILAIYNHVRLMFDSSRQSGGWSPEEEDRLEALIKEHGTSWTKIGKELARVPTDCKDRYLQHLLPRLNTNIKLGKWSQTEIDQLVDLVRQHGHKWTLISKTIGTRTPNQCRVKWTDELSRRFHSARRVASGHDDITTKPWKWRRKDRSNLVHFLLKQEAKSRSDIDWTKLDDEVLLRHDPKHLDNRARILLNEAGAAIGKEVSRDTWDDLMAWLKRRYPVPGVYFTPGKFDMLEAGETTVEAVLSRHQTRVRQRQKKSEALVMEYDDEVQAEKAKAKAEARKARAAARLGQSTSDSTLMAPNGSGDDSGSSGSEDEGEKTDDDDDEPASDEGDEFDDGSGKAA
ncbi:RNA polymerase I enhancer binding protein [Microbotryomycetes sp. JL201]|nr:RNA polymerase I enhancer binding protein [Microbotryomycetes sp. JL201]